MESIEDARSVLPKLIKLGSYTNIYNVKWWTDSKCLEGQVVAYIFTDDIRYFNPPNSKQEEEDRPEVRWLKAALEGRESDLLKINRLMYNSMNIWNKAKSPMKDALTITDIDLRSLMQHDTVQLEEDEYKIRKTKVTDDQGNEVKHSSEVHNHLHSSMGPIECAKWDAKCKATRDWMDCTYYEIKCL